MGLPKIFHSKTRKQKDAWQAAMRAEDTAKIGALLDEGYWPERCFWETVDHAPVDILKLFIHKKHEELNKTDPWDSLGMKMARRFLEGGKFDRLEMILDTELDFNRGYYRHNPIQRILACGATPGQKLQWLEKMTARGIDRLRFDSYDKTDFLKDAIAANLPEAVDLGVRLGINPRASDEMYLRRAAQLGNRAICLQLIHKHGADIELARLGADANKELAAVVFLERLQKELSPPAPQDHVTLETLSGEIKALRLAFAELSQIVRQQNDPGYVARLDKPAYPSKPTSVP